MLGRAVIVTRTPWPLPAVFSKLDGLTRFLAPLLPAPQVRPDPRQLLEQARALPGPLHLVPRKKASSDETATQPVVSRGLANPEVRTCPVARPNET